MFQAFSHSIIRAIILALLLVMSVGQPASAEVKYYRYDGNMPFIKMMLNMMVAMGILDKVYPNAAYGLYGNTGSLLYGNNIYGNNNLYLRYLYSGNPYLRTLALRGLAAGSNNSPLLSSPWMQSPWATTAYYSPSPLWGNPGWGVLPRTSHPYAPYSSRWSAYDLSGWVDEPWESSVWNEVTDDGKASSESSKNSTPIIQNFYNVPDDSQQRIQSPLKNHLSAESNHRIPEKHADKKRSPLHKKLKEKPCITEFCGLKKPDLNGLWVAQDGELLGINDDRYMWSDGTSRYLNGEIKIQNEYLLTHVDDYDEIIRFKYKLAGDYLLTLRPDGVMREFTRVPVYRHGDEYRYFYPYQ